MGQLAEQILQPEKRSNTFAERIFVGNHTPVLIRIARILAQVRANLNHP
jgi:hypothetical protein